MNCYAENLQKWKSQRIFTCLSICGVHLLKLYSPNQGILKEERIYRAETSTDPWLWSKMLENISGSDHMEIPLVLIAGCNCSSHWVWRISYTAPLSPTPLCTYLCHPTGNLCVGQFSCQHLRWNERFNAGVATVAKETKQDGGAGKNFQLNETKAKFVACREVHLESCSQTTEC